jgi:DNA polymerase
VAEEEVSRRMEILGVLPLPPFERRVWEFDQRVNDRGMPVDREFVEKAYKLALRSKQEALDKQNAMTGLENANSTDQLKPWLKARGYPFNTLRKETVESVMIDPEAKLTPEAIAVLKARKEASSTSYQKLAAILRQLSPDNRLRGQFVYMGSARCGRWAGNAVQLQNMARPAVINGHDFENMDVIREARELVCDEKYDEIKAKYGSVLLVIKSLIRTVFVAPKRERLNVVDLNAIETRCGAWIAGCTDLLNVFQPLPGKPNGRCPYLDMASKLYAIPNDKLEADYASKDPAIKGPVKRMRQISKPGILAAIYRQSGGGWGYAKKGYKDHTDECIASKQNKRFCDCPTIYDKIKTGLWGYAAGMGVDMPQEQAAMVARVFREAYKEIPEFWFALENAVADVMKGVQTVRRLGPNGCIVIDKLNIENEKGEIVRAIMRMQLPSGRYLHYIDARLEQCKMPWKNRDTGEDVYREALVYAGVNQDTKQWDTFTTTHGGKLFENLVQAIARDILATKLLEFESNDMPVVGHVHDEGICLVLDDPFSPGYKDMVRIMSKPVDWAPGLLLGADGFEDKIYHK